MDSIDSQLANASKTYEITKDKNCASQTAISNFKNKFFTLQRKKEDVIKWFGQPGYLLKTKHILVSSALADGENIEKINPNMTTLKEGEESLVQLE